MAYTPTDPLFADQWYLRNTGQSGGIAGMDVRVDGAWTDYTGDGVRIVVIDDGVFHDLPDLAANYDATADLNAVTGSDDGSPVSGVASHGTTVSGFLGAPMNGLGIVGVAYESTFTSFRVTDDSGSFVGVPDAWSRASEFDITNNSYGAEIFDPVIGTEALEQAATVGRDGLGTVNVIAGGNARHQLVMATQGPDQDSPYQISVAATDADGRITAFSTPGANIFVSAPGEGVLGNDGMEMIGFRETLGTSFSAPIVSGVAALVLEANPGLGYRDVHEILGYSAYDPNDTPLTEADIYDYLFGAPTLPDYLPDEVIERIQSIASRATSYPWTTVTNGGTDWNGGGLTVSHDFGLGQVDARAATRLAETWSAGAKTTANLTIVQADGEGSQAIPDGDAAGISQTVTVTQDIRVEAAVVDVTIPHGDVGDLQIELIAPHGTVSYLIYNPDYSAFEFMSGTAIDQEALDNGTFLYSGDSASLMTTQVYGESSPGDWTLRVADTETGTAGTLEDWSLTLYGGAESADDRYVYTDQYGDLTASDPSRTVLTDTDGGTDTINASAVSGNVHIDLSAGAIGTIDGAAFSIADGTEIENLHTGDGEDILIGSSTANHLIGGRGDDLLVGGDGDDTIDGGRALDAAGFSGNSTSYAVTVDDDGTAYVAATGSLDTLTNVEILVFEDGFTAPQAPSALSDIGFDAALYLDMNPDLSAAGYTTGTAYAHYLAFGIDEGRAANAFFDTGGYLANNPDVVAAGVNPLQHYCQYGWQEGRDPSAYFNTELYLEQNPDVEAAGVNPLDHFLRNGVAEGRLAQAAVDWIGA